MTTRSTARRLAAAAALLAAGLPAQDMRLLDRSGFEAAVFDSARGRTLALGSQGETLELVAGEWRESPLPYITDVTQIVMAYDRTARRTWLVEGTWGASIGMWQHDGIRWTPFTPPNLPPPRVEFLLEHDAARDELVLFGGLGTSGLELGDTWSFDGTTWSQHNPASSPPSRRGASSAWDSARSRIVAFGGRGLAWYGDTWEWDGTSWTQVITATAPSPRHSAATAYAANRGATVLFGGVSAVVGNGDLWEYDGTAWQPIAAPPPAPEYRPGNRMVFDENVGEALLLGGQVGNRHFESWSWDGARWLLRTTTTQPQYWSGSRVIAEPGGSSAIRIGQSAANPAIPTTFRWDGAWTALAAPSPPVRIAEAVCTTGSEAYLFGGYVVGSTSVNGDFWRWDGTAWTNLSAIAGPSPRSDVEMAYDWANGEVVLFGGATGFVNVSAETWVFDGTTWSLRAPATVPPARCCHGMSFDFTRSAIVMFGGHVINAGSLYDTWTWNGTDWAPVASAVTPTGFRPALAWDDKRQATTLVTWRSHLTSGTPIDAWTLGPLGWSTLPLGTTGLRRPVGTDGIAGFPYPSGLLIADSHNLYSLSPDQAEVSRYGAACTAGAPGITASERPRPGAAAFRIDVAAAPPGAAIALLGATASASVGIAGCTQLVQPGQAVVFLPTSTGGFASAPLPIPNHPSFVGVDLFFQAAALDPSAPNGFTLSRGLRITIGD